MTKCSSQNVARVSVLDLHMRAICSGKLDLSNCPDGAPRALTGRPIDPFEGRRLIPLKDAYSCWIGSVTHTTIGAVVDNAKQQKGGCASCAPDCVVCIVVCM